MRPTRPNTFLIASIAVSLLSAPPLARAIAADPAADSPGAHALPPADVPEAKLVPAGAASQILAPTAERLLDEEALAEAADAPDEPAIADEIDKESAELEAMRKAEESSSVLQEQAAKVPAQHAAGGGRIALLPELDHDLAQLQAEYDIPIEVNEAVVDYVRFFQSAAARKHFVKWLGRSHAYIDRYREILREEGMPQDTVFLAMIESGFGNFAYSRARASGPWQFIAATGRLFGLKQDFWVDERRDPERSARAAARYLKLLHEQTGDWRLAWAGYNAGVGRIFRAKEKGYDDFWSMAAVKGRRVLRPETKGYVPKLMAAAIVTKHPEAFGFKAEEIERQSWRDYDEVTVAEASLLSVLAQAAGASERDLMDLNPELRRACTPPREYRLKIPKGQAAAFAEAWPAVQESARVTFATHVLRRGETVASVAARYGVSTQRLMEMNGLRPRKRVRSGQEIVILKPAGGSLVAARTPEPQEHRAEPAARARRLAPVAAAEPAAPAGADHSRTTLRVQAGDTLWSISRRFGVELGDLCRWNGIGDPRRHKLLVGAQLVVYGERG